MEEHILNKLAGGSGFQLPVGMRYAIDGRINVGNSKAHIERDGAFTKRVVLGRGDGFGLVCTRPCFAPGYLTGLTRFPADCSGRIVRREWGSDCSRRGQRLCSRHCGSFAAETLHNQVAQCIGCSGQSDKALQGHGACRVGIYDMSGVSYGDEFPLFITVLTISSPHSASKPKSRDGNSEQHCWMEIGSR